MTVVKGDEEKHVARKRLMAELVWQAVTEGKIELPNGTKMEISPDDLFATVQFLYKHIDGPPVQELDITSAGEKIKAYVGISPEDWDKSDEDK